MLNRKQIIVIGSVVVLMGLMLSLDIQGLIKPNEGAGASNSSVQPQAAKVKEVSLEDVSTTAQLTLNASLKKLITDLEAQLKSSSESEKLSIQKKLAQQWDDINQSTPAAFYYELIAEKEPNF
jgi:hypothetical protein